MILSRNKRTLYKQRTTIPYSPTGLGMLGYLLDCFKGEATSGCAVRTVLCSVQISPERREEHEEKDLSSQMYCTVQKVHSNFNVGNRERRKGSMYIYSNQIEW